MFSMLRHLICHRLSMNNSLFSVRNHAILTALVLRPPCNAVKRAIHSVAPQSHLSDVLTHAEQEIGIHRRIKRSNGDALLQAIETNQAIEPEQSIVALQCFGELMAEEQPAERTKLAQKLWSTLQELKVQLNINHYNAMLKVHLDNRYAIDPEKILVEVEERSLAPTRRTYELLAEHYARVGDTASILRIIDAVTVEFDKPQVQLYNALIEAYGTNDNLKSAELVIEIMQESDIEPNADTHVKLLCIHAMAGDISAIMSKIVALKAGKIHLHHLDAFRIIETLVSNGHPANIHGFFQVIRRTNDFNDDAIKFILQLLGKEFKNRVDVAFGILELMHQHELPDGECSVKGHFIVRQAVRLNWPLSDVVDLCDRLNDTGQTTRAHLALLQIIRETGSSSEAILAALRALRARSIELDTEHFHVLFQCTASDAEVLRMTCIMTGEFGIRANAKFTRNTIAQHMDLTNPEQVVLHLRSSNVPLNAAGQAVAFHCMRHNRLRDAAHIVSRFSLNLHPRLFQGYLIPALLATNDFESYGRIAKNMYNNIAQLAAKNGNPAAEAAKMGGSLAYDTLSACDAERRVDVLNRIIQCFVQHGIKVSQQEADRITAELSALSSTSDLSKTAQQLRRLVSGTLKAASVARVSRRAPKTTIELEVIVTKLGNETPTMLVEQLRKHYYDERNSIKLEQLLNKFNTGIETHAQLIELQIDAGQPEKALKSYANARRRYVVRFCLHGDWPLKLVAQLIECDKAAQAIQFLDENKHAVQPGHAASYAEQTLFKLLNLYQLQNAPDKVLRLWHKLSEINAIPNIEFKKQLGSYLKEMNVEVPFELPSAK